MSLYTETYTFHNKINRIQFCKSASAIGIDYEVIHINANGRVVCYKGRNELTARMVLAYEYNSVTPVARMEVFK